MPTFRDTQSYLSAMRATFDGERARGKRVTLQYIFTGAVEGACYATIADGELYVAEGRCPAHAIPDATVTVDFTLWQRMLAYREDMLLAYQAGRFTVEGDVETFMESDSWFRR